MRRENADRPKQSDEVDAVPLVVIEATEASAGVLARDLYAAAVELGPHFGMDGVPLPWERVPAKRRAHLEAVSLAVLRKRVMAEDLARPHRAGRPKQARRVADTPPGS